MKKSKILALLLAAIMLFALIAACADEAVVVDPEEPPTPPPVEETPAPVDEDDDEDDENGYEDDVNETDSNVFEANHLGEVGGVLTVAVNLLDPNAILGWGNAMGNAQMRDATRFHSSPITFTRNAEFIVNPAVAENVEGPVENADGSRTWTVTLREGLRWSDGEPLTARDYVFRYLFAASPAMSFSGPVDEDGEHIDEPLQNLGSTEWAGMREVQGLDAFRAMENDYLSGLRLIDELTYTITISAYNDAGEPNFPYFYELTYVDTIPEPMHIIAPGLEIVDTENGVRLSGDGLTYELLRETVDDGVDGGYRYTMGGLTGPGVSAGPYFLAAPVDMDAETIVLSRNPYFHGTYDGVLPHIETIILRRIDAGLVVPEMQVGGIDLSIQSSGPDIAPGLALVEEGGFDYFNFPRNGSGGLFFHTDVGPTQFEEVRRAIAWTLDRHEFNNMWAAGHATTNDTLIAVASWMYIENRDIIDSYITYNYTLNLANATAELEAGGWVYNADGEDWEAGDGPRHKEVDGELMPLVLRWASPEANEIGAMLASLMTEPANSVGIYFDQTFVTMADFSPALLGLDPDNRFSMINGGLGIPQIDAVWFSYNPDPSYFGTWNWTRSTDAELYSHALGRRQAESREEYLEAWLGFISRFNVYLPVLPLNADTFHDFYREGLLNYGRTDLVSWSYVIAWAHLDLDVWPNQ